MNEIIGSAENFYNKVRKLLRHARKTVVQSVNKAMVITYFEIGKILSKQGRKIESRFYLGKYNLYKGKLKLAEYNFKEVAASNDADEKIKQESEAMLALIERLKED